jgi:hypothetical protein
MVINSNLLKVYGVIGLLAIYIAIVDFRIMQKILLTQEKDRTEEWKYLEQQMVSLGLVPKLVCQVLRWIFVGVQGAGAAA